MRVRARFLIGVVTGAVTDIVLTNVLNVLAPSSYGKKALSAAAGSFCASGISPNGS